MGNVDRYPYHYHMFNTTPALCLSHSLLLFLYIYSAFSCYIWTLAYLLHSLVVIFGLWHTYSDLWLDFIMLALLFNYYTRALVGLWLNLASFDFLRTLFYSIWFYFHNLWLLKLLWLNFCMT